jgi:hypothetical protein
MVKKIKIISYSWPGQWYARDYLQNRTCEVIAENVALGGEEMGCHYEVKHPKTKKAGYYVRFADTEIIEQTKPTPSILAHYEEFLPHNIKKSHYAYPYNYDSFLNFFNDDAEEVATGTIYTDRLRQWDWDKHNLLCKKHFGNEGHYWQDRDPKAIEKFLCDWTEKKMVLVAVIQCVDVSNGFPHWRLDYYEIPAK